jgi:hypothetical protein
VGKAYKELDAAAATWMGHRLLLAALEEMSAPVPGERERVCERDIAR